MVRWHNKLRTKLFLSYVGVIAAGVIALSITIGLASNIYVSTHMQGMTRSMQGLDGADTMMGSSAHAPFQESLREAIISAVNFSLAWAVVAAVLAALALSIYLSRRISRPVLSAASATERIAAGDFSQRLQYPSADELGILADSLNRMAERLEEVENKRRQLMGDVAHELRTPLTTIRGYMEGLIDGIMPANPEVFASIRDESERLGRLIDDLQRLSRLEEGQEEISPRPTDLCRAVDQVLARIQPMAGERGVRVEAEHDGTILVSADPDKLTQILLNLITNALTHAPEGKTVRVITERASEDAHTLGWARVRVIDNGPGIPPEDLPLVFERFYRSDRSRTRRTGGAGIGLTITKFLVEAHGGSISAESDPGVATTFSFTLPLASA